jgi:hypothetical protein
MEQRPRRAAGTLICMTLELRKRMIATIWFVTAVIVALAFNVGSLAAWGVVAAVAIAPPLVMLRLWKHPAETITQTIHAARR